MTSRRKASRPTRGLVWSLVLLAAAQVTAVQVTAAPLPDLRWRLIGPLRSGWSTCATGVPGKPAVFYFGAADGGVWKTTDAGRTWNPIFDRQPASSIGALAVASSNPDVLYAAPDRSRRATTS